MNGFLIAIFLIIGLVMPALIFMRAYGTAFSGLGAKDEEQERAAAKKRGTSGKASDQPPEN